MQITDCPTCHTKILVPGNQLRAVVRCPSCASEFSLDKISGDEISVAEIVRSETLEDQESKQDQVEPTEPHLEGVSDVGRYRPSDEKQLELDSLGEEVALQIDEEIPIDVPSPFEGVQPAGPIDRSSNRQRAPKRSNLSWEVFKVGFGGITGIVLAQILLWWLPGNLRRDPLGVAPQLPNSLAFLAPNSLRHPTSIANGPNNENETDGDPTLPRNTDDPSNPDPKLITNLNPEADLSNTPFNQSQNSKTETDDNFKFNSNQSMIVNPVANSDIVAEQQLTGLIHMPVVSGAEFDKSLQRAKAILTTLNVLPKNNRLKVQRQLYIESANLARATTLLARDDPLLADRLRSAEEFLRELGRETSNHDVLGVGASTWIGYSRRKTTGIAAAGSVCEIVSDDGAFYETKIELSARPNQYVYLVSLGHPGEDPRIPFDVDSKVIVLGTICDDPKSQIHGYQGERDAVIWKGLHILVE